MLNSVSTRVYFGSSEGTIHHTIAPKSDMITVLVCDDANSAVDPRVFRSWVMGGHGDLKMS